MLQNIRNKAQSFGAILLLGLLIFAFAIWGIDFQFGTSGPVIEVNGEEVSSNVVSNAYARQIQNFQQYYPNGIPEIQQQELKQNVIEQFVRKELLDQHTKEKGYRLSDVMVWDSIKEIPSFQIDGKFDAAQFEFMARRNGLTADGLFNETRQNLVLQKLSQSFVDSEFVTEAEARMRGELQGESRTIREIRLPVSEMMTEVEVDDAAVAYEYDLNQGDYMTAEMIRVDYIEIDKAQLAQDLEVSDDVLRTRYQAGVDAGQFTVEEQRDSRHILVAINDDRDEAAALSEANALRERILAGEDFAELAEQNSDDTGSKPNGGSLGWNTGEAYVGPFREALFSMTVDQITEPVKTRYGYHIIKLEGVRGKEPKAFDEAREQLLTEYRDELALDKLSSIVNEVDEVVYDIDDSLTSAAQIAGVEVKQSPWFSRASGGGISTHPEVREAAFSTHVLNDNLNSSSINLDGKYIYLRLNEHRPERLMTIDEVRPRIEARLKAQLAAEKVAEKGQELLKKLREGTTLDEVATDLGLTLEEAKSVKRSDASVPAAGRKALFAEVLTGDSAVFGGAKLANGDFWVYELNKIVPGQPLDATQKADLGRALANMEFAAYIAMLREKADVVVRSDNLQTL